MAHTFSNAALQVAQKAQSVATLEPMSSFDQEDKLEATVASEIYEETVRALLVKEPWRFAMRQVELNHLTDDPEGRWSDAWQLPPEVLAIRAITDGNGTPVIFDRYNDKIYCDVDENQQLILDYVYRVGEEFWPPDFRMYVILTLGSLFAASITRNGDVIEGLQNAAEGFFADALKNHSQGRTVKKVDTRRMIRRRR